MEKVMCLSREEQDSLRALRLAADETVELSETLYKAVISRSDPNMTPVDPSDLMALSAPGVPHFSEPPGKTG
jgi:hypothetical protein